MKRYYAAYGSNLNKRQVALRCPGAKPFGTAHLKDKRLAFKGSLTGAYLTIENAQGCSVPIGIWEVTERDEHALDRYEGYPSFYSKEEFELEVREIKTGKIKTLAVFCYVMRADAVYSLPTRIYIRTCEEGYRDFGFDAEALHDALMFTRHKAETEAFDEREPRSIKNREIYDNSAKNDLILPRIRANMCYTRREKHERDKAK